MMKFDDLDQKMRIFETAADYCVLPDMFMVARLDGRSFTRLTKEVCQFEAPLGIGLNVVDEKTFESIYFRPFMFDRGNTEAIQYVSWPDNGWKKLRTRAMWRP